MVFGWFSGFLVTFCGFEWFWLFSVFLCFGEFRGFAVCLDVSFGVAVDYTFVWVVVTQGIVYVVIFLNFPCVGVLVSLVFGV